MQENTMFLLCIVVHYASVLYSQSSVRTSDGLGHAFTNRWIKVYKPLFSTYVRTQAYMSFWLDTRVFDVVSRMNLHSTVCQVGDKKKKDNVKFGSYMWGLNLTMSCL